MFVRALLEPLRVTSCLLATHSSLEALLVLGMDELLSQQVVESELEILHIEFETADDHVIVSSGARAPFEFIIT